MGGFLLTHQPAYWATRPTERRSFAAALVAVSQREGYPLDVLLGHCWAEGALRPYMTPTAGSGAYGPLQVSKITCQDIGAAYPPANVEAALTAGVRYMRLLARRHSLTSLNDALLCYGLGYGGFKQFQQAGCSGKPCERPQSVWRHECGCSGPENRYRWKVFNMTRKAAAAGLHSHPWARWRA